MSLRGVGLIGLGHVRDRHMDAMTELRDKFRVVAGCDLRQVSFPAPLYTDHEALLKNPYVDVVVVATPPSTHAEIAIAAMQAGKDVLVEKPPALTAVELKQMQEVARETGQILFTGFHGSYVWHVDVLDNLLKGKPVNQVGVLYRENIDLWHADCTWIRDKAIAGGGVVMDSGINALSIIRRVLVPHVGDVQFELHGSTLFGPAGGVETKASVAFLINGMIPASINMEWGKPHEEARQIVLVADDVTYVLDFQEDNIQVGRGEVITRPHWALDQYTAMYAHFLECLEDRRPYVSTVELYLIDQIYGASPV